MYVFAVRKFPDSDFFILFFPVCGTAGSNKCDIGCFLAPGGLGYGIRTDRRPEGRSLVVVGTSYGGK